MSVQTNKRTNKKLIVSIVVLALVSVASILGIVTVLALTQRNIDSSIFIRFTAIDIDGEVEAAYRVGNTDTWTSMSGETPHVFKASDAESNTQMNPGDITLTSTNNFVEFRYTFRNFGDADYTGILTLDEVATENNMEIQYKYNDSEYSTSSYGLVVEGVDTADSSKLKTRGEEKYTEMVYYVKVSVKELSKSANYSSDFFWLLERYDGEISGEVIPMSTSEFISNGDGTYSVRYKGADIDVANVNVDSSYKIENVWTIPNNFGSAPVTKVIKGDALPTNTKVILGGNISEIASDAFQADANLVEIVFNDKLTTIPANAFKDCTGLKTITIPNSVTSIGNSAFSGCTNVEVLNYSASVTTAFTSSSNVFRNMGQNATKTVVNINSTVIPAYLLYQCSGVDEINISDNVTSIGNYAFYYCSGLTSIEIPNSVISIGDYAFYYCSVLKSVVIPDSVTSIGSYAFYYCSVLTSVVIPNSVTSIGNYAFSYCSGLTSVVIPNSVITIGSYAFQSCSGLTSVEIGSGVTNIGSNAFYCCSGLTSVVIPDSVTSIGNYAFYYCSGLTSVEIGNGVTSIGSYAFTNCSGLTSIVIPNNVTSIGSNAFQSCSGLTSVEIGSGVIGSNAFSSCSGLTSVEISNSVTSIGSNAFSSCYKLVEIYDLRSTQMTAGSYGTNSYAKILSSGANSVIHTDSNGIQYFEYETGKYKVMGYTGTNTEITIPSTYNGKSVTEIMQYAFKNNKNIVKAVISSGITTLGNYSFSSCSRLISVTIPSSVTSIGSSTFDSSIFLMEIYDLRSTQMTAGNYGTQSSAKILKAGDGSVVFSDANGLLYYEYETNKLKVLGYIGTASELVIPSTFNGKSVTEIVSSAFANNTILKKVTISSGVKSIGYYAFNACTNLSEIVIESGLESITQSFYGCSSLKTIWIPATVTTIIGDGPPAFPYETYCEVYCEAESKPSGWNELSSLNTVFKWGYTYAEYLAEINK